MKSHEYLFRPMEVAKVIGPIVIALAACVALLKGADRLQLLPAPAISVDPDSTMLMHQARASRSRDPADIVLLGDSTCLVGVDARGLSRRLPGEPKVLNLSLLIGFGLDVYGRVLSDFSAANPGHPRSVVLLVTPLKLSAALPVEYGMESWEDIQRSTFRAPDDLLGIQRLRRHWIGHVLDTPLRGGGAAFYGFSSGVDDYMTEHHGSLLDFGRFDARERAPSSGEWTLAAQLEEESRAFRERVPAGVTLVIGLTPGPASAVSAGEAERRMDLLREWNQWMRADVLLTNLPASLPDALFTGSAHLNAQGQETFTQILGRELREIRPGNSR